MFSSLQNIIPGFQMDINTPSKIIIEDSNQCTGEWLTYSMLELFLRDTNSKVIFISNQQYYTHYQTVLKKMSGLNMQQFIDKKQLVFLDAFSQPFANQMEYQNLPISTSVPNTYTLKINNKIQTFSSALSIEESFKTLYTTLNGILDEHQKEGGNGPVLVCFENLSGMLLGLDSDAPELDLVEVLNSLVDI